MSNTTQDISYARVTCVCGRIDTKRDLQAFRCRGCGRWYHFRALWDEPPDEGPRSKRGTPILIETETA